MDHVRAPIIRQRPHQPAAVDCDRQRQRVQGRCRTGGVEAAADQLLLHLCAVLDQGEERLGVDGDECGEERVGEYVGDLLDGC